MSQNSGLSQELLQTKLYNQVKENFQQAFSGILVGPAHLDQMTRDSLNPNRSREQLRMLERCINTTIRGKTTLEAGSGHGLTVAIARTEYGANAYGIEPGADEFSGAYAVSRKVLDLANLPADIVLQGVAEDIPFPDGHFDCVFSSNVLEHVQDPQKVIDESLRVLKPGGFLHIVVPNYGSFWEGHYGTFWLPNMPLWLAKLYVKMLGRDPGFLDTLQFITHGWLARMLRPHTNEINIIGWGDDVWEERIRSLEFSTWSALIMLKNAVRRLHRLGLVSFIIWIGRALHWETPIILTVRKRDLFNV